MSGSHRKRLQRLEQKLADVLRQEALVNCICLELTFVHSKDWLEAEMSKTCPVHGFRRFGTIMTVPVVPTEEIKIRNMRRKPRSGSRRLGRLQTHRVLTGAKENVTEQSRAGPEWLQEAHGKNSYQSILIIPGTAPKCRSRLTRGKECCRHKAAIQTSFEGMGVPPFLSCLRTAL